MTQEDKELLLKDLSARISYGVNGRVYAEVTDGKYDISRDLIFYDAPFVVMLDGINTSTEEIHVVAIGNEDTVDFIEEQQIEGKPYVIDEFKPYLRPMSSMTEEEKEELAVVCVDYIDDKIVDFGEFLCEGSPININNIYGLIDWLNAHHFDYRGLIEKGLAIEAPEGMYNIKEK